MGRIAEHSKMIMVAACLATSALPAYVQEAGVDTSSMTRGELYRYAEDLRLGRGAAMNPEEALVIHQALALQGFDGSFAKIASIHYQQGRLAEAKAALEAGRDAGSDAARTQLAIWNVQGRFGPMSDPELGFANLDEISRTSDNLLAQYALARAFEDGTGTEKDLNRAKEIYSELASVEHIPSLRRLGDFAREGVFGAPDLSAAATYYRAAAEAGHGYSWVVLARLHLELGEFEEAIGAYEAAAEAGVARATVELAELHFLGQLGGFSDRSYGANVIASMAENGDVFAAARGLSLCERRSRRIDTLDFEGTLEFLHEQMVAGDATAAAALARAYRQLSWRIPDARQKHSDLVANYGDQLGRGYMREYLHDLYDRSNHALSRQATSQAVSELNGQQFVDGANALRSVEMTAFVYLLQRELNDLGYSAGRSTGRFNTASLRATLDFCTDRGIFELCRHGPLNYSAVNAIIRELASARSS